MLKHFAITSKFHTDYYIFLIDIRLLLSSSCPAWTSSTIFSALNSYLRNHFNARVQTLRCPSKVHRSDYPISYTLHTADTRSAIDNAGIWCGLEFSELHRSYIQSASRLYIGPIYVRRVYSVEEKTRNVEPLSHFPKVIKLWNKIKNKTHLYYYKH